MKKIYAFIFCAILALYACSDRADRNEGRDKSSQEESSPHVDPQSTDPALPSPDRSSIREMVLPSKIPERVPEDESEMIIGEVPDDLIQEIIKDLASRIAISATNIELIRAQEMIWENSSLGCPQPGTIYLPVPVHGYWIVLMYDEKEYDYRANQRGFFFLCEQVIPPAIKPPNTSPDL